MYFEPPIQRLGFEPGIQPSGLSWVLGFVPTRSLISNASASGAGSGAVVARREVRRMAMIVKRSIVSVKSTLGVLVGLWLLTWWR